MSSSLQTILALGLVALATGYLIYSWTRKRSSGCSNEGCAAVSPEVKKLRARLKH